MSPLRNDITYTVIFFLCNGNGNKVTVTWRSNDALVCERLTHRGRQKCLEFLKQNMCNSMKPPTAMLNSMTILFYGVGYPIPISPSVYRAHGGSLAYEVWWVTRGGDEGGGGGGWRRWGLRWMPNRGIIYLLTVPNMNTMRGRTRDLNQLQE